MHLNRLVTVGVRKGASTHRRIVILTRAGMKPLQTTELSIPVL